MKKILDEKINLKNKLDEYESQNRKMDKKKKKIEEYKDRVDELLEDKKSLRNQINHLEQNSFIERNSLTPRSTIIPTNNIIIDNNPNEIFLSQSEQANLEKQYELNSL